MEVPCLSFSSVWSLDYHVSVVDEIKVSVLFQLGDNVEITLNNKTNVFVQFSFDWFRFPLININNVPLLMKTIIS